MKFDIGDWVYVHAKMIRTKDYKTKEIKWERENLPTIMHGRIVGLCKKCDGTQVRGNSCYDEWNCTCSESGYLKIERVTTFWLVRLGMLNKAIPVSEGDLEPLPNHVFNFKFPKLYIQQDPYLYSAEYKDSLRKEMQNRPRDSKGRWIKESVK